MTRTGETGGLSLAAARDAAALVALMQQLKDETGLTYRQLEQRAAERGEVLARSTLADVLRRQALPKEELLGAFLRANGRAPDEVEEWLAARRRIEEGAPPVAAAAPGRPYPRRRVLMITGAGLTALLVAVGVPLLSGDGGGQPEAMAAAPLPTGEVTIRPLRAPALCLTDGRVRRAGEYRTVAVQRPCTEAVPPQTHLTAAGAGRHRIQWIHRDHGKGCLVRLHAPALAGLLEPWENCSPGGPAQLFRIEPAGDRADGAATAYRLRLSDDGDDEGDRCVTLTGDQPGTTATVEPCSGAADQKFLIGAR
ncbi:RICIN domain-containing protein [Streptomyces sp. NPDC002446]